MAHFEGAVPSRPKRVSFPICHDERQWADAVRAWVGELNPELQSRLRLMQPFTYAARGPTVLSVLHDLDIQDKHRDLLVVSADLHGVNLDGSFEYEDRATEATPSVEMRSDVYFEDGAVLGTIHAGAPIRTVGRMILRPTMKAQLHHGDSTFEVVPMLKQFVNESRRCLDILMFGLVEEAESEPDREWSPLGVTWP